MFWNDVLKITILEYYYEKIKKYSIIPKHHMMFWNWFLLREIKILKIPNRQMI